MDLIKWHRNGVVVLLCGPKAYRKQAEDGSTLVEVTPSALVHDDYVRFVTDPGAGAITTFLGITRDTFEGKRVIELEYEAYGPMAISKLEEICSEAREKWTLKKVAIAHRTGAVGVSESSVVIAVSSAHRAASIEACHFLIDELKMRVPIWKRERYEDGSVWKENAENRVAQLTQKLAEKAVEASGGSNVQA